MADRGDTARSTHALNVVFAISSLAMLVSFVWMLYADYDREWKGWQKKFLQVEIDRTNVALRQRNAPTSTGGETLEKQIAEAEKSIQEETERIERENKAYKDLAAEKAKRAGDVFATEQLKKAAKAIEDSVRYQVEMKRLEVKNPSWGSDQLEAAEKKTKLAILEWQAALAADKDCEGRINAILGSVNDKKATLANSKRELDRLRKRRDDLTSFVRQQLLNAPGMDFIQPTLLIKKQVLEGLNFELNFTKKKRIDMCQTCHLAIDVAGYEAHEIPRTEGENFAARITGWELAADVKVGETKIGEAGKVITPAMAREIANAKDIESVVVDLPEPLRSHPRLDLYLSASSPHPLDTFGCSVCHRGSGESVGFTTSDHAPESFHREIIESALSESDKFKKNEEATEKTREEWHEKYKWHKQHHWDYPMLPVSYTEASCLQCHKDSMETIRDAAPTLYKGWKLIEERGCYSCHKIQGWRDNRKMGPSLVSVGDKLTKEFVSGWVAEPRSFRPDTRMPQIFHLENSPKVTAPVAPTLEDVRAVVSAELGGKDRARIDAEAKTRFDQAKQEFETKNKEFLAAKAAYDALGRNYETNVWDDVAIHGIVTLLFTNSKEHPLADPPMKGDAAKGKDQFQLAGCLACHELGEGDSKIGKSNPYGRFGPNLAGIGTKVTEKWLYQWVKSPHAWWADTRMPNLRLADDEAANISAFLMTQTKPDWKPAMPPVDAGVLEREAMTFLTNKFSIVDSQRYLKSLRDGDFAGLADAGVIDKKLLPQKPLKGDDAVSYYVGERWISRQGCFSCHTIGGLEDAQPIGVELTEWGTKEVEKLDFGLLEHTWEVESKFGKDKHPYMNLPGTPSAGRELADGLDHQSRSQWLEQKFRAPRSYDRGRDKSPLDIWRMPDFRLTEDEIHAIATYVLGLVREGDVADSRKMMLTPEKRALEDGWHAIRMNNCVGCHPFDMETIEVRTPEGALATAKGLVTFEEEGEISMQLWEPCRDLDPKSSEATKVSAIVPITEKQVAARRGMVGGGIWPSLMAWYSEKESKGITEVLPFVPPVLAREGDKIQLPWLSGFLKQPYTIRPIVKVHMPTFELSDADANKIALYFPQQERRTYARRLALDTRQQLNLSQLDLAKKAKIGAVEKVQSVEAGVTPSAETMERLLAFAKENKVTTPAPPELIEHVIEREEAYRKAREAAHKGYYEKAAKIAADPTAGNCYSCHYRAEVAPSGQPDSWAPDLSRVNERLRGPWVDRWVSDPQSISPGTKMPTPAEYPKLFDAPREVQMQALGDLMMAWEYFLQFTMPQKVAAADEKK